MIMLALNNEGCETRARKVEVCSRDPMYVTGIMRAELHRAVRLSLVVSVQTLCKE